LPVIHLKWFDKQYAKVEPLVDAAEAGLRIEKVLFETNVMKTIPIAPEVSTA
jgi:hypothetical protein